MQIVISKKLSVTLVPSDAIAQSHCFSTRKAMVKLAIVVVCLFTEVSKSLLLLQPTVG